MNQEESMAQLTCGEISYLWMSYQYETISKWGITFFLQHIEDEETKIILEEALELSNKRIMQLKEIFDEEGYLHPEGFTKSDVHLNAPRLFSDVLYLEYCMQTCEMELMLYNLGFIER